VDDFSYDKLEFEHVDEFDVEYESFLMDNEPECDVFDSNDACSITEVAPTYDTSTTPLDLKPLPDSLKYDFLSHDESLPVIITFDLNQDQEKKQ